LLLNRMPRADRTTIANTEMTKLFKASDVRCQMSEAVALCSGKPNDVTHQDQACTAPTTGFMLGVGNESDTQQRKCRMAVFSMQRGSSTTGVTLDGWRASSSSRQRACWTIGLIG
jgi:hypothetical protein